MAPTVGGLARRVAALERAASTDEVTVGAAPASGTDDVQAVLDAAAAAFQQARPPYLAQAARGVAVSLSPAGRPIDR